MKTFTLKTQYETYEDCYFVLDTYKADGSQCINIWNDTEGPIARLTTCLGTGMHGEAYLDTNNCPWAEKLVEDLEIGFSMFRTERSGFCEYPLYAFDMEVLKEYTREAA